MKKFILGILAFLGIFLGITFAQNVLPDDVRIIVKDPIKVGEAANLEVTMLKNGSTMTNYDGTIVIIVTDEEGKKLKDSEYTVPSRGYYSFLPGDLGQKVFQRGLEIKKEGTFYIEISELNEIEDKILGKQLIHVTKDSAGEIKNIEVYYPTPNASLNGDKVEIIASAKDMPNSEAIVYIDEKIVGTTRVGADLSINYTIPNVSEGQHTFFLEIPDLEGNIIGQSDKVNFTMSPIGSNEIEVFVDPEEGLMIGEMVNISVYTDDTVESVKLKLSDRPENDSMVMNKGGIGEFNQNVWLIGSGEIYLSFETSSFNNSVIQSYDDYKIISVADVPFIGDINVDIDNDAQTADISRNTINDNTVSAYLVDWRVEGSSTLSGKDWSEKPSFNFSDVPYDTIINLNITPYRNKQSKHGAASKTIQFVITKSNCGNGTCDNGETAESCPKDCGKEATIVLGPSCPKQKVSTHTSKVGDNYYLIRDKVEGVKKYMIYSSLTPDGKDKTKIYETSDTSYEYPFDHTSEEDIFMYFRIVGICEDGEEVELTGATKVQVGPGENFFLLMCLTLLIYSGIKLFRQTE